MIGVPASVRTAGGTSHRLQWRVLMTARDGRQVAEAVTAGSLSLRLLEWPRASAVLTVPTNGRPVRPAGHLLPFGARVSVQWRMPDRDPTWWTAADLYNAEASIDRPGGDWKLRAVDASAIIDGDTITERTPHTLVGPTVGTAVGPLIRRTFPAATVTVQGATTALPADWRTLGLSPWQIIEDLTDLCGYEVVITGPAAFLVRPATEMAAVPVDELATGPAGTITRYEMAHERTYNTVVVRYTPAGGGAVVAGLWQDARPSSPTSTAATGARLTYVFDRDGSPTLAQADTAAARVGAVVAGRPRRLSLQTVPRPWLQPGDTIAVTLATGTRELHLITAVTIPLDGSPMELDTRNTAYTPAEV